MCLPQHYKFPSMGLGSNFPEQVPRPPYPQEPTPRAWVQVSWETSRAETLPWGLGGSVGCGCELSRKQPLLLPDPLSPAE